MEVQLSEETRETTVVDVRFISEMDAKEVYQASMSGCVSTLNALLQNNPLTLHQLSLTSFTETPLHIAALLGHREFAMALLEKKSSFASKLDSLGRSPLHLACAEGHLEIAKALLEADTGACMVADQEERLPLHLAAMRGQVDIIEELIRARPEAALVTADGDTVLHFCVRYGHFESFRAILELLGRSSGLLPAQDGDGNTVLHLAVMLNQKRTIRYLVSLPGLLEAIANTENNNCLTALDVLERQYCPTRDFKNLEIRNILREVAGTRTINTTTTTTDNNVVGHVPSPDNVAAVAETASQENNREEHDHHESSRMEGVRGSLMVVVTVVATMLYQAGMSPPGGVWSENSVSAQAGAFNCTANSTCIAGTALLAYVDTDSYVKLVVQNTITLCICLFIIVGLLLMQRSSKELITLALLVSLLVMLLAYTYLQAIELITPKFVLEDHGMHDSIDWYRGLIKGACIIIGIMLIVKSIAEFKSTHE